MTEANVGPFQHEKHTPPKWVLKIRNLKHKYKATKTQLLRKINRAQSSIERRLIPPKDIDN
jgi:hypothetical protein